MDNEKLIKDAQYRKGLSIAFFNATNAAIALVTAQNAKITPGTVKGPEDVQKIIAGWRDWFIKQHDEYYATVIAKVGKNFEAKKTVENLKKCKTYDDLRALWVLLSQDERQDKEIIKVAQELKKQLKSKNEKAPSPTKNRRVASPKKRKGDGNNA